MSSVFWRWGAGNLKRKFPQKNTKKQPPPKKTQNNPEIRNLFKDCQSHWSFLQLLLKLEVIRLTYGFFQNSFHGPLAPTIFLVPSSHKSQVIRLKLAQLRNQWMWGGGRGDLEVGKDMVFVSRLFGDCNFQFLKERLVSLHVFENSRNACDSH